MIGPEAPLVAGAGDALRAASFACFGPDRAAAMIEGSKSFAKDIMAAAGIPTAASRSCVTASQVAAALSEFGPPYVVKDDGLAGGKGVLVTTDLAAAVRHAESCGTVVIEEFLDGPELSLFALCDGSTALPLMPAQDFKRARDGDQGPNTGGMGAYAPLPWLPGGIAGQVMDTVIQPALDELRRRGTPYRGLLYAGLCLTSDGIRVVEFNARFGDPETQVVLDRLATPLGGLLHAAAAGSLARPARCAGPGRRGDRGDRRRRVPGRPGDRRSHRRSDSERRRRVTYCRHGAVRYHARHGRHACARDLTWAAGRRHRPPGAQDARRRPAPTSPGKRPPAPPPTHRGEGTRSHRCPAPGTAARHRRPPPAAAAGHESAARRRSDRVREN